MKPLKPYDLVWVKSDDRYTYIGQVISHPINETIMIRRVPDDPATMEKMKISDLKLVDRKYRWVQYAIVSGRGTFPIDMLRYDMATPVNFKFVEDRWGNLDKPELTVSEYGKDFIIARVSETQSERWTHGRWNSFLWFCKSLKTLRIEGK